MCNTVNTQQPVLLALHCSTLHLKYKTIIKVRISKIFISFSFAAPVVIISNCRCHFIFSFLVCSHQPFLCLFSIVTVYPQRQQKPEETSRRFTHRWAAERVCCIKSQTEFGIFLQSLCRHHPGHNTANAAGFHQRATGSVSDRQTEQTFI